MLCLQIYKYRNAVQSSQTLTYYGTCIMRQQHSTTSELLTYNLTTWICLHLQRSKVYFHRILNSINVVCVYRIFISTAARHAWYLLLRQLRLRLHLHRLMPGFHHYVCCRFPEPYWRCRRAVAKVRSVPVSVAEKATELDGNHFP